MNRFSMSSKLIGASVAGLLILNACGASKTTIGAPPPSGSTGSQSGAESPKKEVTPPDFLSADFGTFKIESLVLHGDSRQGSKQAKEAAVPISAVGPLMGYVPYSEDEASPIDQYDSTKASNVDTFLFPKNITGAVTVEELLYTSTSVDSLIATIRSRIQSESESSRKDEVRVAFSVMTANLNLNQQNKSATITLKVKEQGQEKLFGFQVINYDGKLNRAVAIQNRGLDTVAKEVKATFKCLDQDGSCDSALFRVKPNGGGVISILFRQSFADLNVVIFEKNLSSNSMSTLEPVVLNTTSKKESTQQISSVRLNSFEVVGGVSGFQLAIKTNRDDGLMIAGPLVTAYSKAKLDILLAKSSSALSNSVIGAKLLANNGLGMLKIALVNLNSAPTVLNVMKKQRPVVQLTEDDFKFLP